MSLWEWDFVWEIMPDLLDGLLVTVQATLTGITLAMVLGLFFAMARRSQNPAVSSSVGFIIEFLRSTPLLIQLYFLYFVLPNFGLTMDAFTTGFVGLGLHYGAYTSEVYRAGIDGVSRGQWEASTALSLGRRDTWFRIILPQAIPAVIPALGNYLIAMFKDTPLLSAITVVEMLGEAKAICSTDFRCFEPFTLVGVLFLAVSIPASILVRTLEGRLGRQRA